MAASRRVLPGKPYVTPPGAGATALVLRPAWAPSLPLAGDAGLFFDLKQGPISAASCCGFPFFQVADSSQSAKWPILADSSRHSVSLADLANGQKPTLPTEIRHAGFLSNLSRTHERAAREDLRFSCLTKKRGEGWCSEEEGQKGRPF